MIRFHRIALSFSLLMVTSLAFGMEGYTPIVSKRSRAEEVKDRLDDFVKRHERKSAWALDKSKKENNVWEKEYFYDVYNKARSKACLANHFCSRFNDEIDRGATLSEAQHIVLEIANSYTNGLYGQHYAKFRKELDQCFECQHYGVSSSK